MGPQQGNCCTGWSAETKMVRRQGRPIPNLFGYEPYALRESLQRKQIRSRITPSGNFIVAALAREQWPWPSRAPVLKGLPVFALAIAIMVVTPPARATRRIHLEHGIHHAKRILNDAVVRVANPVPNQLQKTGIYDLFRWKLILGPGGLIR